MTINFYWECTVLGTVLSYEYYQIWSLQQLKGYFCYFHFRLVLLCRYGNWEKSSVICSD